LKSLSVIRFLKIVNCEAQEIQL